MPQHLTSISGSLSRRLAPTLRNRCGLTLLEVLIVLVLLAALGAIVAPVVLDRLDERAFEAAADTTNEQLMMARAHAQATGEPVEVTYSPVTGNVQARVYAPWDTENDLGAIEPGTSPLAAVAFGQRSSIDDRSSSRSSHSAEASDAHTASTSDHDDSALNGNSIAEAWATRTLGRGMRINTHPPFVAGADGEAAGEEICLPDGTMITVAPEEDFETLDDLEHGQEVRLAVFMPDGSAMVGDELWLDDGRGRYGKISINAWSGLPIFQRLADLQARAAAAAQGSRDQAEAAPDGDLGSGDGDAVRDD